MECVCIPLETSVYLLTMPGDPAEERWIERWKKWFTLSVARATTLVLYGRKEKIGVWSNSHKTRTLSVQGETLIVVGFACIFYSRRWSLECILRSCFNVSYLNFAKRLHCNLCFRKMRHYDDANIAKRKKRNVLMPLWHELKQAFFKHPFGARASIKTPRAWVFSLSFWKF